MPSKKPIIQAVMEEETYKKFKQLCTNDSRSASKLAGLIIKKYVNDYEAILDWIRVCSGNIVR